MAKLKSTDIYGSLNVQGKTVIDNDLDVDGIIKQEGSYVATELWVQNNHTYTGGTNVSVSANNVISATDTTYTTMTQADLNTGTGTTGLVVPPKILKDTFALVGHNHDGVYVKPDDLSVYAKKANETFTGLTTFNYQVGDVIKLLNSGSDLVLRNSSGNLMLKNSGDDAYSRVINKTYGDSLYSAVGHNHDGLYVEEGDARLIDARPASSVSLASIAADTINGKTHGNAIMRQMTDSAGRVILGSNTRPLRLTGSETRPKYKTTSPTTETGYEELALISDLTHNHDDDYAPKHEDGYLPLSGGTLTGNIRLPNNGKIYTYGSGTDDYIDYKGWVTKSNSAQLYKNTGTGGIKFETAQNADIDITPHGTGVVNISSDLVVAGDITVKNVNQVSVDNGVVFEGTTKDANKVIMKIDGNPVGTKTIIVPGESGTMALEDYVDKHKGLTYYVEGNTSGTAGTWTGTNNDITSLYSGLTIVYKIGVAGASTTTLNINSLGAKEVRHNANTKTTTHLGVGSVVQLVYDGTYWKWSYYDSTRSLMPQSEIDTPSVNVRAVSGQLLVDNFLQLKGGTMTGNISYNMYSSTQTPLKVYGGGSNGMGISLGAGGATLIGAGEATGQMEPQISGDTESLWLGSDQDIRFLTGLQSGWASRKEAMYIKADGKIGIGSSNATYIDVPLTVHGASNQIRLYSSSLGSNQHATLNFSSTSTNSFDIATGYNNDATKITISPKGSTAMTLLGSGRVGIGTSTPSETLEVNGNIKITDTIKGTANADLTMNGTVGTKLRYGTNEVRLGSSTVEIGTAGVTRLTVAANGGITTSSHLTVGGGLGVSQTGGTGTGISLYGTPSASTPSYGLAFATTTTLGKHGGVQGDWATYLTMTGSSNRGWIFRHGTSNVASIDGTGVIYSGANKVATETYVSGGYLDLTGSSPMQGNLNMNTKNIVAAGEITATKYKTNNWTIEQDNTSKTLVFSYS